MPKSLATSPRGAASIGTEAYQGSASLIVAKHGKLTHSDAKSSPSEEVQDVKATDEVTALETRSGVAEDGDPPAGSGRIGRRRRGAGPRTTPAGSTPDPCLPELPCTPRRCELGSDPARALRLRAAHGRGRPLLPPLRQGGARPRSGRPRGRRGPLGRDQPPVSAAAAPSPAPTPSATWSCSAPSSIPAPGTAGSRSAGRARGAGRREREPRARPPRLAPSFQSSA